MFACPDVLRDSGLLKDYQFAILDNQDLCVVNRVPVGVKREFTENCVEIFDICQRVSDRGGIRGLRFRDRLC